MNEKLILLKQIVEYCEKNDIIGSYNAEFEDKLVSFDVKERREYNKNRKEQQLKSEEERNE